MPASRIAFHTQSSLGIVPGLTDSTDSHAATLPDLLDFSRHLGTSRPSSQSSDETSATANVELPIKKQQQICSLSYQGLISSVAAPYLKPAPGYEGFLTSASHFLLILFTPGYRTQGA